MQKKYSMDLIAGPVFKKTPDVYYAGDPPPNMPYIIYPISWFISIVMLCVAFCTSVRSMCRSELTAKEG